MPPCHVKYSPGACVHVSQIENPFERETMVCCKHIYSLCLFLRVLQSNIISQKFWLTNLYYFISISVISCSGVSMAVSMSLPLSMFVCVCIRFDRPCIFYIYSFHECIYSVSYASTTSICKIPRHKHTRNKLMIMIITIKKKSV